MVPITNYVQWYTEPGRDMYPQGYGELFAPFDAHITIVSPSELLTDVATSEDTNLAFVQLDMEGFVRVFHRIRRIDPIMGGPQDAYSGRTVALVGDVSSMGVICCGVPPAAFHRTAVIDQVATTTAIAALLQTQPGGQVVINAYRDLSLEYPASPVRSRYWMLIPPRLVSEVLQASSQPEGLTPRDLWENVVTPLLQDEGPIRSLWPAPPAGRPHSRHTGAGAACRWGCSVIPGGTHSPGTGFTNLQPGLHRPYGRGGQSRGRAPRPGRRTAGAREGKTAFVPLGKDTLYPYEVVQRRRRGLPPSRLARSCIPWLQIRPTHPPVPYGHGLPGFRRQWETGRPC
jgi:hypothetical protein